MKNALLMLLAALAVLTLGQALPAFADDSDGALIDAGSIITSTDGGRSVVAQLKAGASCYKLAMRCEGAQSTRYVLCATSTCAAAADSQLLDYDVTQDLPVNCVSGATTKNYIALRTDDAGVPYCLGHVSR